MAKGFFLVDIPDNCRECNLRSETGLCLCEKKCVFFYGLKYEKPDWCPIREVPDRKEPTSMTISPLIKKQYSEFDKGWNDCLDYLEGENGK